MLHVETWKLDTSSEESCMHFDSSTAQLVLVSTSDWCPKLTQSLTSLIMLANYGVNGEN